MAFFKKAAALNVLITVKKYFSLENLPENGQFCFKSQFYDKMGEKNIIWGIFWGYDHLPESAVNTFSADHAYMREKGLK